MGGKAKVPYELKLASVLEYIKGNKTSSQLATKLGVNYNTIIKWVRIYNAHEAEGLITNSKNKYYSPKVKYSTFKDYLDGKGSLIDICRKYNILSDIILQKWILKYNNSHNKFKSHNSKEIKIMDQWKVFGELLNLKCII